MRIRPHEHKRVAEILEEELEHATRRISERLSELERKPVASKDDSFDGVRSFYQDLTDNDWTKADEEALGNLSGSTEEQIKLMMREKSCGCAFRLPINVSSRLWKFGSLKVTSP